MPGQPQSPEPEPLPTRSLELDCLARNIDHWLLEAADHRAAQLNVTAERVLIGWRVIDEESYCRSASAHCGIEFEDFEGLQRHHCALADADLPRAIETGIVPIVVDGRRSYIVALRHLTPRTLGRRLIDHPGLRPWVRFTTQERFAGFVEQIGRRPLADNAVRGLQRQWPRFSSAPAEIVSGASRRLRRVAVPAVIAGGLIALPLLSAWASVPLSIAFLCFAGLRIVGCLAARPLRAAGPRVPERELPVYSIIAALYREAASVGQLVTRLRALDYPHEKLQIILALEADDPATRAAVEQLGPIPNLQIVIAARDGPRTKPKALNYALPFVRGTFVAIYDAEDEPEPGQLRAALNAFLAHGPDVACVQASLCVPAEGDIGWLARMFAAEYAGQFELFMPGATALDLPLPLGGSSNHFHTETLRACGAWDPFNVTEDADLGLLLARQGFRAVMFASTTYEEAPISFRRWLPQRTRWMKGWMQTWAVHMRQPVRLGRSLGWRGFVGVNLLVGGNVLTALACPGLILALLVKASLAASGDRAVLQDWTDMVDLVAVVTGFIASIAIGAAGLRKRGRARDGWVLALMPLYWLMLSLAAWRALYQLVSDPYKWEKTEHGPALPANRISR